MRGVLISEERVALERTRGIWPDRVVTDYFDRWLAEKPDVTAAICFRTEGVATRQLTWRQLGEEVAAFARGLSALGVRKGDVVSFQLPNWWEFIAIHLACVRIGAVSNPLMPIFRRREMTFMVKQAESKVLITPTHFRGFDHGALALDLKRDLSSLEHVFLVGGEEEYSLDILRRAGAKVRLAESGTGLGPNDVMQLLFTSGTTGESKGVLHTSNTLVGTILKFIERMQLTDRDVVFMPSPLAHQAGFAYGLTLAILLGAPLLLLDVWNPGCAAELMEAHRATYTFAATPFLSDLTNLPGIEGRDLSAFKLFVTSGAPIPPVLVEQARARLHARIVSSWGMTEGCSVTTTFPSGYKADESDGCAVPGAEVRIVDLFDNELPRGQAGLLKFRGASMFVGYLKRPELYDVDERGWFNTGDIARMDAEGYIRICGREKDIIIRGGENIPVLEIENMLYRMPQITAVAIVAMPDARMGERACAFVTLQPEARLTSKDMQEFLAAEGVSKHFWPERLKIIERMPLTPSGKIQKFVLREMVKDFVALSGKEGASKAS